MWDSSNIMPAGARYNIEYYKNYPHYSNYAIMGIPKTGETFEETRLVRTREPLHITLTAEEMKRIRMLRKPRPPMPPEETVMAKDLRLPHVVANYSTEPSSKQDYGKNYDWLTKWAHEYHLGAQSFGMWQHYFGDKYFYTIRRL